MSETNVVTNETIEIQAETAPQVKPLTVGDIVDRSKAIYERVSRFSKRSLAHFLSTDYRLLLLDDREREIRVFKICAELKKWEKTSRTERTLDSIDRRRKEFEKLEANGWKKPRKKRRKRARRLPL